jgi:IS605 OrfB family transposase
MPVPDLMTLAEHSIALEARERMDAIVDGQVAAGMAKKGPAREHLRSLRRMAYGERQQSVSEQMREAGIEIVRVQRG